MDGEALLMGKNNRGKHRRRLARCSVCFQKVKGHAGRPRPTCTNIPIPYNPDKDDTDGEEMASNEKEMESLGNPEPDQPEPDPEEQGRINKLLQETLIEVCAQLKELKSDV